MEISFKGHTVFLTGAGRGIGRTIKEVFLENGAEVIAPSRQILDLADTYSIERYLASYDQKLPDIFVHCAGINTLAGIDEIDPHVMQDVMQVNCFSAVLLLQGFAKEMKARQFGRAVFLSSVYAVVSRERRAAYSASKNALTGIVKSAALEMAADQILVNAVAPGYVMTDMTRQNLSCQEIEDLTEKIPTGKFQSEMDVANLVCFLCSDLNQSITGQLISVDGGFTCR